MITNFENVEIAGKPFKMCYSLDSERFVLSMWEEGKEINLKKVLSVNFEDKDFVKYRK